MLRASTESRKTVKPEAESGKVQKVDAAYRRTKIPNRHQDGLNQSLPSGLGRAAARLVRS
jgi:hypothetical protein